MLMDADAGTVDHDDVAVVGGGHRLQDPIPDARLAPSNKAIVAGRVWSISLGDISLGRTCPKAPENSIQHPPIINPNTPFTRLAYKGRFKIELPTLRCGENVHWAGSPD